MKQCTPSQLTLETSATENASDHRLAATSDDPQMTMEFQLQRAYLEARWAVGTLALLINEANYRLNEEGLYGAEDAVQECASAQEDDIWPQWLDERRASQVLEYLASKAARLPSFVTQLQPPNDDDHKRAKVSRHEEEYHSGDAPHGSNPMDTVYSTDYLAACDLFDATLGQTGWDEGACEATLRLALWIDETNLLHDQADVHAVDDAIRMLTRTQSLAWPESVEPGLLARIGPLLARKRAAQARRAA
jgi:hypothetical protein